MYYKVTAEMPNVLVIDDNVEFSSLVCTIASNRGFNATAFIPGPSFIAAIKKADLLFLDLSMPGINGVDILKIMAVENVGAYVVLMSGVRRELLKLSEEKALEWGVNVLGVLTKPVRVHDLDNYLHRLRGLSYVVKNSR